MSIKPKIIGMSYEKRADYEERYLFPPSLEDWVGADHPARFIREFVDALDLKELGFRERTAEEGRPSYGADLLLKAWLYGYLMRIRSSRALERACRENVGLIWLTGMNEPDHNTLWRFFSGNKKALRKVFGQGVKVAAKAGLVGLVLHAVDGTKIAAQASRRSAWHKADLEKALDRLESSIAETIARVEASEAEEQGEYRLPEELCKKEQLRNKIKTALDEMKEAGSKDYHPKEPDARMMNCGASGREFGYNAQAVADAASGLIVAQDVVNNAADHGLLVEMVGQVESELGQAAEETLADAGYRSAAELRRAEEKGYGVLINLGRQREEASEVGDYHPSRFRYDETKDQCICPRGEALKFEAETTSGKYKYPVRVYRCKSFRHCPARWQCSKAAGGRKIELSVHHASLLRQREKQRQEEKQKALRRRPGIIEPVFGHIKQAMGFRRWTYSGLDAVQTQWSLLCTAVNLSKMHKFWLSGQLALPN
jgi:transposase